MSDPPPPDDGAAPERDAAADGGRAAGAGDMAAGGTGTEPADGWRRLAGRMVAVHGVRLAMSLAPLGIALLIGRGDLNLSVALALAAIFGGAALRSGADIVNWATTRYRVTPERVEVRSGLVQRSELSIPRDRVRTVNVTAKPLHRLFRLTTVEVGTGRSGQSGLRLDAVPAEEGSLLRAELLARGEASAPSAHSLVEEATPADEAALGMAVDTTGVDAGAAPTGDALARIRWQWLPYHLLSPWTLALPLIVLGGALQALDSIGIDGTVRDAATDGYDRAQELPVGLTIAVLAGLALLVGIVAASAIFVESWWDYRLTREPGGTLHVRRGLLTSRSITIEQRRLRGVELAEPLPLRAAGGATLLAIVSGLKGSDDGRSARVDALLPAAPRSEASAVATAVLRWADAPRAAPAARPAAAPSVTARAQPTLRPRPSADTARGLHRPSGADGGDTDLGAVALAAHPPAALRRRLVRAAGVTAVLVAMAVFAGPVAEALPPWAPLVALVAIAPALLLGRDAYRSLGHGLSGRHLVTRHGTFVRRSFALERDGVIGWTVRRSPFQRRSGLVTLTATTAAGAGGYRIVDASESEAVSFAAEAVPGVLAPFLVARGDGDRERSSETTRPAPDIRTDASTTPTAR